MLQTTHVILLYNSRSYKQKPNHNLGDEALYNCPNLISTIYLGDKALYIAKVLAVDCPTNTSMPHLGKKTKKSTYQSVGDKLCTV